MKTDGKISLSVFTVSEFPPHECSVAITPRPRIRMQVYQSLIML